MLIFLFCYLITISSYFFYKNNLISKKHYCVFIAICLTILVGFRHETMGLTDTQYVYLSRFQEISYYGLNYIFTYNKDLGFQLVTFSFIKVFGENFHLYLLLMGLPYISAVSYLIYKYSSSPMLSFIAFISLQYFEISFTLMRQVVAMAILIIAFKFLTESKPIKFVITVVISYFFHQIAIIFLFLYPLSKINSKAIYLCLIGVGYFFAAFLPQQVLGLIGVVQEFNERYSHVSNDDQTNLVYFFICLLFILVGLIYLKDLKKSKINYLLFKISALAAAIAPLTIIAQEFSRVSYLFGMFNIIFFPNAISYEKDKQIKFIIICLSTIIFIVYFLFFLGPGTNVIPYRFFWE